MSAEVAISALRSSAALSRADHVAVVRVAGSGAFAVIDGLCPRELFVRDGQMLHTLLLNEDGRPLADVYVCADDREFLLLAEGVTGDELADHVRSHAHGADIEVTSLSRTHNVLSLDGPYAWEVFAELAGPEVIGQPYMTFFHDDQFTAFRAGKTGEYGYYLLVPGENAGALWTALLDRGAGFDLATADLPALDHCALENWFFNIRREGAHGLSPIELQLQWRVSYRKAFFGAAALAERRTRSTQRIVTCAARPEIGVADRVVHEEREIGTIVNAGYSAIRGDWVALALLDRAFSHVGIDQYRVHHAGSTVPIRTLAAPALNNRSLYVNPQLHSYLTRAEVQFPPLVLPSQRCASPIVS